MIPKPTTYTARYGDKWHTCINFGRHSVVLHAFDGTEEEATTYRRTLEHVFDNIDPSYTQEQKLVTESTPIQYVPFMAKSGGGCLTISPTEYYNAVLSNAIRMPSDDQGRLIKDLVDRGASLPKDPIRRDLLMNAINKWGTDAQKNIVLEELLELAVEMQKFKRIDPLNDFDKVQEAITLIQDEVADVIICMATMKLLFGSEKIDERITFKLNRLERRLSR